MRQADVTRTDRAAALLKRYKRVRLEADLGGLGEAQREMIRLLVEAARVMDAIYWIQAYDDRTALLASISDPGLRTYAEINYGPWDRLSGNEPFLEGIGAKPPGANFYPADLTPEEFETAAASNEDLRSLYTMVRRGADGTLVAESYHEFFQNHIRSAAEFLSRAAALTRDPGLKHYLELRADALETDDYRPSDRAWMDMKHNVIDVVIGPIETYEDRLFGYKAAYEAFVLVKDREWSDRLARYVDMLPLLQQGLPVDERYKQETPGTGSDLGVYDVVYYAGDANAGAKTIAINLPNDEEVQLEKGARRLQLKNAMRAKFDGILLPIATVLIAGDQRSHVTFDAFFSNTLFHEVAHGLGIKTTVTGRGTVREALRDHYTAIEEGKADILGLHMVGALHELGQIDGELMDYYVTFLAGMLRSIRFGAASAHGQANLLRFNYFMEQGAVVRSAGGVYRVDGEAMQAAITSLSETILVLQGDGDYTSVDAFLKQYGEMDASLQTALDRVNAAGIPVDVVFEQGVSVAKKSADKDPGYVPRGG